jgi:hypothetical protein
VVTARVNEYFEVTYRNFTDIDSMEPEIDLVEKFALESDARDFVNSRKVYVLSFVKITDMFANEND